MGQESYAARITADAKKIRKPNSRIMKSLNSIIKTVSALILPVGILLFCKEFFILQVPVGRAVTGTVAALIGMIPEGLILLTSVVLAVGVIQAFPAQDAGAGAVLYRNAGPGGCAVPG